MRRSAHSTPTATTPSLRRFRRTPSRMRPCAIVSRAPRRHGASAGRAERSVDDSQHEDEQDDQHDDVERSRQRRAPVQRRELRQSERVARFARLAVQIASALSVAIAALGTVAPFGGAPGESGYAFGLAEFAALYRRAPLAAD